MLASILLEMVKQLVPKGAGEGFESYSAPCDANSGAGFNYSRWRNDAFDRWIEVAGSSPDLQVRAQAYPKAGEQISSVRSAIRSASSVVRLWGLINRIP